MAVFTNDGVSLEYERTGASGGFPVLVHHGLVGGAAIADEWTALAMEHAIELIAVARPGYGRSTPYEMTSIAQWASLLEPLLDALGIRQAGVIGVSAGAPYSYALAAGLPDRITAVAILSGLGKVNEAQTRACYPSESQRAFEKFATGSLDEVRQFWQDSLSASLPGVPEGHRWHRAMLDSLANGAYGVGREAYLQQRDWGFRIEELRTPVALWHSRLDDNVPFATAEIIAARIPGAQLNEQVEPGHMPSPSASAAAFSFLAHR